MTRPAGTDRPREATGWRRVVGLLATLGILLIAGAMVAYGAAFHSQPVQMEQKVDTSQFSSSGGWPPGFPGPAVEELPELVEIIILEESEPELIREVSFGGVVRLPSGEVKRTYSGRPPSQCPT